MKIFEGRDPFKQVLTTVHEAVRKSLLVNTLYDKLEGLPIGSFPFAIELGKLRDIIAPHIGDTRILFPEFTPHDENLHVVKLFELTDKLFGTAYQQLNAAELFLLASALYAHDWGMAIGEDEKAFLRAGAPANLLKETFTPLLDEENRLSVFVQSQGLFQDEKFPELSDDHLRQYVRLTHARRSAARVRAHFHEYPAVGEALAHICEGHWLDFATLDDALRFPREYEVAGQTTHLLAIALQLRLVDLFHITEDRTPYALWRFVSPTDRRSKEEWKKHRALHAVAVNDFPPGRAIKVQGFTEDEEVWAGLQDLRHYCEDQLRHTLDLCARNIPKRYMLDFVKLEWAVTTGSLRPVTFSFAFDNKAMFRILSDDIYDGEPRVFLRELLQNSIDAIRTRLMSCKERERGAARRKIVAPPFDTTIYFEAEHQETGDIKITCRDYGIGMDEHVIRNYFTVAGVSYYRSEEFERRHLGFNPVSRFGVGILSCFMVADSLEVRTYRDPECGPPLAYSDIGLPGAEEHRARRLHLRIPAVDRQFIVKDMPSPFEVGTEISLTALRSKIKLSTEPPSDDHPEPNMESKAEFRRALDVTGYISEIAGFVEFPIHIEERWPGQDSPSITLVLHPDRDSDDERQKYDETVMVQQLSREYPWETIVSAESAAMVQELMTEYCFDVRELLGDKGYEGWCLFPGPVNETWDFGFDEGECRLCKRTKGSHENYTFRWNDEMRSMQNIKVYRDGILLKDIASNAAIAAEFHGNSGLPPTVIRINLSSSESPRPNLSRTTLVSSARRWDADIWPAIYENLRNTRIAATQGLSPAERLYRLGWNLAVFGSHSTSHLDIYGDDFPTLWLCSDSKLVPRECAVSDSEEIPLMPEELSPYIHDLVAQLWDLNFESGLKLRWLGPDSLFPPAQRTGFLANSSSWSSPAKEVMTFFQQWKEKFLVETRLQFLEPPNPSCLPISESVCKIHPKEVSPPPRKMYRDFLRKPEVRKSLLAAVEDPSLLQPFQLDLIQRSVAFTVPIPFSAPFAKYALAGSDRLNINHLFGSTVLRCVSACCLYIADADSSDATSDAISNLFSNISMNQRLYNSEDILIYKKLGLFRPITLRDLLKELFSIIERTGLIEGFIPPAFPDTDEVVPKIEFLKHDDCQTGTPEQSKAVVAFGTLITEYTKEEGGVRA